MRRIFFSVQEPSDCLEDYMVEYDYLLASPSLMIHDKRSIDAVYAASYEDALHL